MQTEPSNLFFNISQGSLIISNIIILLFIMKQTSMWTRLRDRVDSMWKEYCDKHDIPYTTLHGIEKER